MTVRPLKRNNSIGGISEYVSMDTNKTYLHTPQKKYEYEDNFLRNIYRKIEFLTKHLERENAIKK